MKKSIGEAVLRAALSVIMKGRARRLLAKIPQVMVVMVPALAGCFSESDRPGDAPEIIAPADLPHPNVVILLADDLGYGDIGAYGGKAQTPTLDKLATEGVLFSQFYSAAPLCSPSRAGLLTSRWPVRADVHSYIRAERAGRDLPQEDTFLDTGQYTLAEYFAERGYATAHFGKWHLGAYPPSESHPHPSPHDHGFQYTFGTENNAIPSHQNPENFFRNGKTVGRLNGFSSQLVVDEAITQLPSNGEAKVPFFHYIAFHEPHSPIASPPEIKQKYSAYGEPHDEYLANVENLDIAIGRYLAALDGRGLADNTIIIFFSDNGPIFPGNAGNLRGEKSAVYEGGIRVPAIFRGPGFEKGLKTSFPANAVDIFPTLINLIEAQSMECSQGNCGFDGTDITPVLQGERRNRQEAMYWFFYRNRPEAALRKGNFVLLASSEDRTPRTHWLAREDMEFIANYVPNRYELYDLNADPEQENDLSVQRQDVTAKMALDFRRIHAEATQNMRSGERLPGRDGWPTKEVWPQE